MQTIPIEIRSGSQTIPLTTEQARVIEAVSPTVDLERTTGGVVITVEDVHGSRSETVYDGNKGDPGQSPTATVVETEDGAVITVTDAEGTTTAEISNGRDGATGAPGPAGADGVSPSITVTDITGGHRVTITDATGQHSFDVMDGQDGQGAVQDVQVNGVSVLSDGVANVPVATPSSVGVLMTSTSYGTNMPGNSPKMTVGIEKANDIDVKAGSGLFRPIVPFNQHASTFYGLAKAAGFDEKNSTLPVGQYTDEAKVAIQKMLGVYQPPWELLNDITLTEEGRIDLTADANGTPYDLLGVYIRVLYVANLTAASTGYGRYVFEDSNGVTLNAETGKYSAQTAQYAKFIYVFRDGTMAIAVYSKASATGGGLPWNNKNNMGVKFDFKNIQRIYLNEADVEPAGARIQIYGQRAY